MPDSTNAPEVGLECIEDNPSPFARGEKRSLVAVSHDRRGTTVGVLGEDLADLRPEGDQPGPVELGQANGQQRVAEIDIRSVQANDFAIAETCAVEQQQDRTNGHRFQRLSERHTARTKARRTAALPSNLSPSV